MCAVGFWYRYSLARLARAEEPCEREHWAREAHIAWRAMGRPLARRRAR